MHCGTPAQVINDKIYMLLMVKSDVAPAAAQHYGYFTFACARAYLSVCLSVCVCVCVFACVPRVYAYVCVRITRVHE